MLVAGIVSFTYLSEFVAEHHLAHQESRKK